MGGKKDEMTGSLLRSQALHYVAKSIDSAQMGAVDSLPEELQISLLNSVLILHSFRPRLHTRSLIGHCAWILHTRLVLAHLRGLICYLYPKRQPLENNVEH